MTAVVGAGVGGATVGSGVGACVGGLVGDGVGACVGVVTHTPDDEHDASDSNVPSNSVEQSLELTSDDVHDALLNAQHETCVTAPAHEPGHGSIENDVDAKMPLVL